MGIAPQSKIKEDVENDTEKAFDNILVLFTTVEEGDWDRKEEIYVGITDILSHFEEIGAEAILIYPYAHLSNKLEEPRKAYRLLKLIHKKMAEETEKGIYRAPFGWYKEFSLTTMPHPLAESYREI